MTKHRVELNKPVKVGSLRDGEHFAFIGDSSDVYVVSDGRLINVCDGRVVSVSTGTLVYRLYPEVRGSGRMSVVLSFTAVKLILGTYKVKAAKRK